MTMNVVRPARTSVPMSVPRSPNLTYDAIASTPGVLPPTCDAPGQAARAAPLDRRTSTAPPGRRPRRLPVAGPAGPRTAALLLSPGLLLLAGVETEQLHLDEAARVELELAGRE